jgi:hypothetical protein
MHVATALGHGAWFAVPELATLESTVIAALAIAAAGLFARGRRALHVDTWQPVERKRAWLQRIVLIWCAALAAVLGVFPGLALDLGPPAAWFPALVMLAAVAVSAIGSESPRRVVWLLCTSYGLAAATALAVVRHVF